MSAHGGRGEWDLLCGDDTTVQFPIKNPVSSEHTIGRNQWNRSFKQYRDDCEYETYHCQGTPAHIFKLTNFGFLQTVFDVDGAGVSTSLRKVVVSSNTGTDTKPLTILKVRRGANAELIESRIENNKLIEVSVYPQGRNHQMPPCLLLIRQHFSASGDCSRRWRGINIPELCSHSGYRHYFQRGRIRRFHLEKGCHCHVTRVWGFHWNDKEPISR